MTGPRSKDVAKKSSQAKAELAEVLASGLSLTSQDIKEICRKHGLTARTVPFFGYTDFDDFGLNIGTVDYKGNVIYYSRDLSDMQRIVSVEQAKRLVDMTKRGRRLKGLLGIFSS